MSAVRTSATARITLAWIVTSGLTVISWALATTRRGHHLTSSVPEALAVLAIAAVKARFITQEFMEVRLAPTWLRRGVDAWFVGLWAALVGIYLYWQ
jgi:hypothetical protein